MGRSGSGFGKNTDAQVGRLIDAMAEAEVLDNTLVLYILGDNGGSAEGGIEGTLNTERAYSGIMDSTEFMIDKIDDLGGPNHFPLHPVGWTLAMNTPYRWSKSVASHFGGTRNGMVAYWPKGITRPGEVRHQWHHINDVFATVLEAAGLEPPVTVNGIHQQPLDGTSMQYSFNAPDAPDAKTTQYFEMVGNRGIYHEGWMAGAKHRAPWEPITKDGPFTEDEWELFDLTNDWTQAHDLAEIFPEKLREMQDIFMMEAARNHVFPLDHRYEERHNPVIAGRPDLFEGRTKVTFRDGMTGFREESVPNIKNRSHAITATVEILDQDGAANGVIVQQGGRFAGWTIYLHDGHLTYVYNYFGLEEYTIQTSSPLTSGTHIVRCDFNYDGGGIGLGATVSMSADGETIAEGRVERTVPYAFSYHENFNIGVDLGAPVTDYPWKSTRFKSRIETVDIELTETTVHREEVEGRQRHAMSGQ